jgi:hypothetical protein
MDELIAMILDEVTRARYLYPRFNSGHEGFAVIREEVDELWDEVKASKGLRQSELAGAEAVQIAAMAIRFALDLCDVDGIQSFVNRKHKLAK